MLATDLYKELYSRELHYHSGEFLGIKFNVAINRDLTDDERRLADDLADQLQRRIETNNYKSDPKIQAAREEQKKQLLGLFGDHKIYVEELPNGYAANDPYWGCFPWFKVTTPVGFFVLGWRKRVISISWFGIGMYGATCNDLFGAEDVTKESVPRSQENLIHAWGVEKAQEYVNKIIEVSNRLPSRTR